MKALQTEFVANNDKVGNTTFKQLRKENGVALYQRLKGDRHFCYELFIIKTIKAGTPLPGGKKVEEDYEQYPGAAQWGKTAWSAASIDIAEDKFDQLVKKLKSEAGQPKRRGRKSKLPQTIVLPKGEFTMKMLIADTGMTQPVLYLRLQALIKSGAVVEVRRERPEGGRGRATVVYRSK
jgi:hypothetical protein